MSCISTFRGKNIRRRAFFFFLGLLLMVPLCAVQLAVEEVLGFAEGKREEQEEDQVTEHLERLLFILHTLVSHRDGAKVTKPEAVCQVIPPCEYQCRAMSFYSY